MKLLLADDHTLFRDSLVQYIERASVDTQVSVAKDFYQAYEYMQVNDNQDLVILDLRMPGMNGLDGLKKMREGFPDTPVALMSGVAEVHDVKAAIDLGAVGYFPKTLSGKALLNAIQVVLGGAVFIPVEEGQSNAIMPSHYGDRVTPSYGGMLQSAEQDVQNEFHLTPREFDVLRHLLTGASNKDIAEALGVQVVTVKLHVRGICQKLNAKNRTQAALIARERKLVEAAYSD